MLSRRTFLGSVLGSLAVGAITPQLAQASLESVPINPDILRLPLYAPDGLAVEWVLHYDGAQILEHHYEITKGDVVTLFIPEHHAGDAEYQTRQDLTPPQKMAEMIIRAVARGGTLSPEEHAYINNFVAQHRTLQHFMFAG